MNKMILALSLGALTLGTAAAIAEMPVNLRQANQERRIDAGTRSGKLTRHEAMHLKSEQRLIAMKEKRMRARHGGHLTMHDKRIIHQHQAAANRDILRKKDNAAMGRNKLKL